ncbi:MAG: FkbM family methyltransferase [Hyphomonadaceae bacterium]
MPAEALTHQQALAFLASPKRPKGARGQAEYAGKRAEAVERISQDLPGSMVVSTTAGFLMEIYPASDFVTSRAFLLDGVYEPPTHAFMRHTLRKGEAYIDVGSNIGTHVIPSAHYVGELGAVIAIEPNPDMVERLLRNVRLNALTNVHVIQAGAGETSGKFKLFNHPLHPGNGWMVPLHEVSDQMIADLERSYREHPEAAMIPLPGVGMELSAGQSLDLVVHDVEMAPFESLVSDYDAARASIVKIDVEGAEMSVIRAAEFLWSQSNPPCCVVEYEERYKGAREEIFRFFADRGWGLYIVSCNEKGMPAYNRLTESYVASQFENLYAIPPQRLTHCTRDCQVFVYDHDAMRERFGEHAVA